MSGPSRVVGVRRQHRSPGPASMSAPEPYGFMSAANRLKRPSLSMSPSANAIAW